MDWVFICCWVIRNHRNIIWYNFVILSQIVPDAGTPAISFSDSILRSADESKLVCSLLWSAVVELVSKLFDEFSKPDNFWDNLGL